MKPIGNYLSGIHEDLLRDVSDPNVLCGLSALDYRNGAVPSYSSVERQRLYLLKYAYGYVFEYGMVYKTAMERLDAGNKLDVVSVGCGALLDYAGLKRTLGNDKRKVNYLGIDPVDWSYKIEKAPGDDLDLRIGKKASECFGDFSILSADIYMFPKSLSELSAREIAAISIAFRNKPIIKDKFCLCATIRTTEKYRVEDLKKLDLISKAIIDSGYKSSDNPYEYFICEGKGRISLYDSSYCYPDNIRQSISSLGSRCNNSSHCGNAGRCMDTLCRNPILTTKEVCYKVITFETDLPF